MAGQTLNMRGLQKYLGYLRKAESFFRRSDADDRGILEKMKDKYRLVIMNDDTFEEITSLRLTPLSVYVALSSLMVITAILVTLLIVWTPLKRYIPGYGDFRRDREVSELKRKVRSLEDEVESSLHYFENIRRLMNGDLVRISREVAERDKGTDLVLDSLPKDVDRIPEDELLRTAVARGTLSRGEAVEVDVGQVGEREVRLGQLTFIPPVSGEVVSGFNLDKAHLGIDIAASRNTAIKAAGAGVVIFSGYTVETGYSITIQHPNNVVTMYKHNSVLLQTAGTTVKAGEAIALIGNSGENTSGPHLHFELWHKGRAVDPRDYISFD